jgi:hypothetical protein
MQYNAIKFIYPWTLHTRIKVTVLVVGVMKTITSTYDFALLLLFFLLASLLISLFSSSYMTSDLTNKFGIFYLHLHRHASQIFTLQSLMKDEFRFATRSLSLCKARWKIWILLWHSLTPSFTIWAFKRVWEVLFKDFPRTRHSCNKDPLLKEVVKGELEFGTGLFQGPYLV